MIVTLKAYYKLKDRAKTNLGKLFPGGRFNADSVERTIKEKEFED
jgi:hypothetical protein